MSEQTQPLFWADEHANEIVEQKNEVVVATGISPSGYIHVGNFREVATADAIVRAVKDKGKSVRLIYIADNYDPLRKVYPFLDEKTYAPYVGNALSEIPSPKSGFPSYSECFLHPFLKALENLDINIELVKADELYKQGAFLENTLKALEKTQEIRKILKTVTGKDTDDDWSPFTPICEKDGRMDTTKVLSYDLEKKQIEYSCSACGHKGTRDVQGGGKLTWRVDWPARWQMLGVTVEPFGKDHASRGGSYDSGKIIAKEIFDYEAPYPIIYEWIGLKGVGDMSSSKGNVISINDMLEVLPPEVLKYWVFKAKPNKHLSLDPSIPILSLMDEYDDPESNNKQQRAFELAQISSAPSLGVPFKHLISLVQIHDDVNDVAGTLERSGYKNIDKTVLSSRMTYAKQWLEKFGPEDMKFSVQKQLPELTKTLSAQQKQTLKLIGDRLEEKMSAQDIHELIYAIKNELDLNPKDIFYAIYASILGKEKGPRAGFFLSILDTAFIKQRFAEV